MNNFHVYIVDGLCSDFLICVAADDLPLRISKLTHGPIMASDWLFIVIGVSVMDQ